MKYFVLILALLAPQTSSAKSPCDPPPDHALTHARHGSVRMDSQAVTLLPTDLATLLREYHRCRVAWKGTPADWDLYKQRMDQAEQVAIAAAEQEPLLRHLQVIEAAAAQAATPPEATATVLAQLRSLQLVVAKLQHQVQLLTPPTVETPPPPEKDGGDVALAP